MKALLLAAGYGTRLRPITNHMPKCLVKIDNKPLLEIWIETLFNAGITEVLINTHYLKEKVEEYIDSSSFKDKITLTYEKELLGTGSTLLKNKNFFDIDEPFMVIHADNLSICDYKDFISAHYLRDKRSIATMMLFNTTLPKECGIVELDQDGIVIKFHEKVENPPSNLANGAVYIFEYSIFDYLEKIKRKNIDISKDLIPQLLNKINTYKNNKLHIDIGTINTYKQGVFEYKELTNKSKYNYLKKYFRNKNNYKIFEDKTKEITNKLSNQRKKSYKNKKLLAIYDCIDLPISNDIGTFLISCEIELRRKSLEDITLVFVIHSSDPSPDRHPYINKNNIKQYIYNFTIEHSRLFKNVGSLFIINNRNEFTDFYKRNSKNYVVHPKDYMINLPMEEIRGRQSIHAWNNNAAILEQDSSALSLTPPHDQIQLAQKWIKKYVYPQIPITITLREWDSWDSIRNTKLNQWQKLINFFSSNKNLLFIVIRDYHKLYEEDPLQGKNIIYCNEAVVSNSFRASLYQESTLNLFVCNGSAVYAIGNQNTNYIFFNIYSPKGRGSQREQIRDNINLYYNDSFQGSSKYQKVVWEADTFEVLKKETIEMLDKIEQDLGLYPEYYNESNPNKKIKNTININAYDKKTKVDDRINLKYYLLFFYIQKIRNLLSYKKNIFKTKKNIFYNKIKYHPLKEKLSLFLKISALKIFLKYNINIPISTKKSEFNQLSKLIYNINIYNHKVIIYGSGTIGRSLANLLEKNIITFIDLNESNNKINQKFEIKSLTELSNNSYEFDYIIITPKYREYEIAKTLVTKYNVENEKILLF